MQERTSVNIEEAHNFSRNSATLQDWHVWLGFSRDPVFVPTNNIFIKNIGGS
jgi:hypothetical protein